MVFGIVSLVFRASCLCFLYCLRRQHRNYYLSKPLSRLSLTDMVQMDLLTLYCATVFAFCLVDVILDLCPHQNVPPMLAEALLLNVGLSLHGLLIYMSVIAIVHYLHVRQRSTSLLEWLGSDTDACCAIRLLVLSIDCFLQGLRMLNPGRVPVYYALSKEEDGNVSLLGLLISVCLATAAATLNLITGLLIQRQKELSNEILLVKSTKESSKWLQRHMKLTLILFFPPTLYLVTLITIGGNLLVHVYRHFAFTFFTVLLPFFTVMLNSKLRTYILGKLIRNYRNKL